MNKLTYKIVTFKGQVLKRGIPTLAEAREKAAAVGAKYEAEYTLIDEPKPAPKTHKKSAEWLARHPEAKN